MRVSIGVEADGRITAVGVRRGRLLEFAFIFRFDDEDVREEAESLARKIDQRVVAVLNGDIEAGDTPTPIPTATPEPTPLPGTENAPPTVLDSFRFSSTITADFGGNGFELSAEGAFEGRDRLSCTLNISIAGLEIVQRIIIVGEDGWLHEGRGFQTFASTDPEIVDDLDTCPGSPLFWEDFDFSDLGAVRGEPETKNGVASRHISLDDLLGAAPAFGFSPEELAAVTVHAADVWVARDGGWPLSLHMDFEAPPDFFGGDFPFQLRPGRTVRATLTVNITDVNDPSISVEPPDE